MAGATKLQLQERVPLPRTAWKLADLTVLSLLLALLARRAASVLAVASGGGGAAPPSCTWCWLAALVCEAWFTVVWLLNVNSKWNPVRFDTHPERLAGRTEEELPAVDMFVTTADPRLEPPAVTVNTVLSLLALDYPAGKLACYVSDDGCSPVTCFALREAAEFARLWVPFCRKHGVGVRAPFVYFSSSSSGGPPERGGGGAADDKFQRDWTAMKSEYEKLASRIENADEESLLRRGDGEFAEFVGADRRDHPTIIKVLWDNGKAGDGHGIPSLIYISREKGPRHPHHFKAGAMNVLVRPCLYPAVTILAVQTRVSAVVTNAPIMLNMDCDMFANNPQVALHAMCLLLGFDDELQSGFVQAPQKFYGTLKDDPFGNQMEVLFEKIGFGIAGLQGMFYGGTGCFHRRKVIYGVPPESTADVQPTRMRGSPSYKELQKMFGSSRELIESARSAISGELFAAAPMVDLASRIDVAKEVSACSYEAGTCWGQEVGWVYGSMTEDILTGQRIHAAGWRSAFLTTDPPAFLGGAPTGGPASLTQYKRWATGLLEIILSRNNPILACTSKHLEFRQCLAYLVFYVWPVRAPFELCYALLGPYCLLANKSFLPKASEPWFVIPLALFLTQNVHSVAEYMECRQSARAWWNNHRMQRIVSSSAWLLAFLTVVLKTMGLSETVFEVTRKEQGGAADGGDAAGADPGRFTFDSSPVFVPPTALTILTLVAIAVGAWRAVAGAAAAGGVPPAGGGPGVGEFVCCGWLALCFWPFVRGLAGKGSYGIPWSVKIKAVLLVAAFVHFCTRN
nr:cellulose synthase-like protein H1 isoform X1 [Setaria viridis]